MGEYIYCQPSSPLPLILTPEILGSSGGGNTLTKNFSRHSELPTVLPSPVQGTGASAVPAGSPLNLDGAVSSELQPPAIARRLRVFQALSPSRITPGLAWGSKVNLTPPMWIQVDAAYFSAPGGCCSHLHTSAPDGVVHTFIV